MTKPIIHAEEYLYLPHLSDNNAIIAWGAFFFTKPNGPNDKWDLIDDDDLNKHEYEINRHSSIGENSEPYAKPGTMAEVELIEKGTANIQRQYPPSQFNHAVFTDLKPDTTYTYKVTVNGKQWAGGPLLDWDDAAGAMLPSAHAYNNEFHTFPSPEAPSPSLTFAILGDFGRGVKEPSSGEKCQKEIAQTLMQVARETDLRLILSNGDNIYHNSDGTGKEDDDWFFTYFQPYRFLLNRVPVFPAVGNHDEGETFFESSDDRKQVEDNTYIRERFEGLEAVDEAALDHGLFYRFRFGKDIEFICLDTSKKRIFFSGGRFFRHEKNRPFIEKAFPADGGAGVKWRLPYFHHPPYCAGPSHNSKISVREFFSPYFVRAGVRAVFSGHQHTFQHSVDNDRVNYFVSGGSGKFDNGMPLNFEEARTQAWGGNDEGHLLLVKINGNRLETTPYGHLDKEDKLRPINIKKVAAGAPDKPPFVVEA